MRHLIITLNLAWLTAAAVTAQESLPNPLTGQPQPLAMTITRQAMPNMAPLLHLFVTINSNEFALQVPDGFRAQNEPAQGRILLPKTDNTGWMTFRIIRPPYGSASLDAKACRDWLLSQHPEATITSEATASAGSQSGPAFDLQWKTAGGLTQSSRTVFINSAVGIVEFALASSTTRFPEAKNDFGHFLMSFRPCLNGKHELPPVPAGS